MSQTDYKNVSLLQDIIIGVDTIKEAQKEELKYVPELFKKRDETHIANVSDRMEFFRVLVNFCRDLTLITEKQHQKMSTQGAEETTAVQIEQLFSKAIQKLKTSNTKTTSDKKQTKKQIRQAVIASDTVKPETVEQCVKFLSSAKDASTITSDHLKAHALLFQVCALSLDKTKAAIESGILTDWISKVLDSDSKEFTNRATQAFVTEYFLLLTIQYGKLVNQQFLNYRREKYKKRYEREEKKSKEQEKESKSLLRKKKERDIQRKKQELMDNADKTDIFELEKREEELFEEENALKKEDSSDDEADSEDEAEMFDENEDDKLSNIKPMFMKRSTFETLISFVVKNFKSLEGNNTDEYQTSTSRVIICGVLRSALEILRNIGMIHNSRLEEISVLLAKAGISKLLNYCLDCSKVEFLSIHTIGPALLTATLMSSNVSIPKVFLEEGCLESVIDLLYMYGDLEKKATSSFEPYIAAACCHLIANCCSLYEQASKKANEMSNVGNDNKLIKRLLELTQFKSKKIEQAALQLNLCAYAALNSLLPALPLESLLDVEIEKNLSELLIQDATSGGTDYFSKTIVEHLWDLKYSAVIAVKTLCERTSNVKDESKKSSANMIYRKLIESKVISNLTDVIANSERTVAKKSKKKDNEKISMSERKFYYFIYPAIMSCMGTLVDNSVKSNDEVIIEKLQETVNSNPRVGEMLVTLKQIEEQKVETSMSPKNVLILIAILIAVLISFPVIIRLKSGRGLSFWEPNPYDDVEYSE